MLIGVIADDFTGASDIANTLAKSLPGQGGLRTVQYLGVPTENAAGDVEAGVIALKSRSIAAKDAVEQSLRALNWLLEQECRQIVFKYCSTFDSTPNGNIGQVGEALANALGVKGVVACPAFPGAGRTVYQGHLFVRDMLLNESGLQNHPLNPMTDADIRRWLRKQTTSEVGHVGIDVVHNGSQAIATALNAAASAQETLVIVDAISDGDLVSIGRAVADHRLITGGSGIAIGLPANFIDRGLAKGNGSTAVGVLGPDAILAGSCSGATREQVELHKTNHPTMPIDVDAVMDGKTTPGHVAAFLLRHEGRAPLAYSSGAPETVRALQEKYGRENVARALDQLFAETAQELVRSGIRRLVVAGGETSGAVVSALELGALSIGPEIDPGVPVLVSGGPEPVALALKSGNFGSPDFFTKALERLAGR
ncbi:MULTISPECIES: 3-oxo-tetronate kinase [unclassified Sinorhizobium]|uniref:3-oxo-tetronate kinase n=1 Tax=unclassified Sinorhizobium TaxID=2613772 RepID=UPI0024C21CFB|nr:MULTISPECIES: 3-oxo-tetronate kinase [unclassified Sinorhizobium]MDK1378578.1 four-carbon acid sugar kinase family protein [Sinorhizobium sp. 6-70]MDK1480525.1 four-carbon acid sugar kinase family protein [Sinorhizobium sp. 6-117]